MFDIFFQGIQKDFLVSILPVILCTVFRFSFIKTWCSRKISEIPKAQLVECFRYGFWWGMDFNAYIYLFSMLLVTIPSVFFDTWHDNSIFIRVGLVTIYCWVLYCAFMGKMIFYYHYHDIYNRNIWLGKNADKGNLLDIFFNQNHGALILLGMIPYLAICVTAVYAIQMIPAVSLPIISDGWLQYILNFAIFLASVAIFYWFRFGGTFKHRDKPEWDEVPPIVKQDVFLAKATVDDLISLELILKHPVPDFMKHTDEEAVEVFSKEKALADLLPAGADISQLKNVNNPLKLFKRTTKGPRIKKPKKIFIVYGESHAQSALDETFRHLHLMEASEKFRQDEHTISINNFLSGGLISPTSVSSILLGMFDAELEINERVDFWNATTVTALAPQLKRLGYSTHFWYGGKTTWGSLVHFCPAAGFDECKGGPEFCPEGSPSTWLGVYDHIFLEYTAKLIKQTAPEDYEFHFVYTTSNHGPYDMPYWEMGFDTEKVMPDIPEKLKQDKINMRRFAGVWYADQAINKFVADMKGAYPDSLFVVTGDHASPLIPYNYGLIERNEQTLRERLLPCFHIHHPELTKDMFAGNSIGSHMNIMATFMELIAPQGFEYYSLFPSLLEHIEHVVTPYCWMTESEMGFYNDKTAQSTEVTKKDLLIKNDCTEYVEEKEALEEITGWMVRHPELLIKNIQ